MFRIAEEIVQGRIEQNILEHSMVIFQKIQVQNSYEMDYAYILERVWLIALNFEKFDEIDVE